MDSHSFRIIAGELAAMLDGARLEKIHGPHPGVFVFLLFAQGVKRRLVFRHERQNPLLFFTEQSLSNPPRPSALVMRLRKYCAGRRLGKGTADFASRRLAFPLPPAPGEEARLLLLDMVNGPSVVSSLEEGFGVPPVWPGADITDALCDIPWQKREKEGPWQEYAVLTPFLRECLAALDPLEGRALLVDLEAGGGQLFLYADKSGKPAFYAAWPLPEAVRARRSLQTDVLDLEADSADDATAFAPWLAPAATLLPAYPSLARATLADEPRLFADLGASARKEAVQPARKADKKLSRLLDKLDQEEKRLRAMLALREDAKALQSVLWQYPAEARQAFVDVPAEQGGMRALALDPLRSVRDNMAHMFKQSARGARGLAMLEQRRQEVSAEHGREDGASGPLSSLAAAGRAESKQRPADETVATVSGARPMPPLNGQKAYKDVARFMSSDGFILLRGKNARGNHNLLKIGSAHDFWLHAEDGPSAHLIIRRSHAADAVPERTLLEAAALVGEKSWQRQDGKARVMVALLRHVHPVKGAAPGTVKVDAVQQSLLVALTAPNEPGAGTSFVREAGAPATDREPAHGNVPPDMFNDPAGRNADPD